MERSLKINTKRLFDDKVGDRQSHERDSKDYCCPVDFFLQAALGGVKSASLPESRTKTRPSLLQQDHDH